MKQTTEYNYAELMRRAEKATSRKEAIDLIHLATRVKENDQIRKIQQLCGS